MTKTTTNEKAARTPKAPKTKPSDDAPTGTSPAVSGGPKKMTDEQVAAARIKLDGEMALTKAQIEKAEKSLTNAENHYLSAGQRLTAIKAECKVLKIPFATYLKDNDMARSTAYRVLAIASGDTTIEEIRAKNAEAAAKSKSKLKAAAAKGEKSARNAGGESHDDDLSGDDSFDSVSVPKGPILTWLKKHGAALGDLPLADQRGVVTILSSFMDGS